MIARLRDCCFRVITITQPARLERADLTIITHRKSKHIFQFFQENEIRFLNILLVNSSQRKEILQAEKTSNAKFNGDV